MSNTPSNFEAASIRASVVGSAAQPVSAHGVHRCTREPGNGGHFKPQQVFVWVCELGTITKGAECKDTAHAEQVCAGGRRCTNLAETLIAIALGGVPSMSFRVGPDTKAHPALSA